MKVMLVHPTEKLRRLGQPLGLSYIASYLESVGHKIKILDLMLSSTKSIDISKEIKQFDPDVIGVTSMTPSIYSALKVLDIAKKINPNCLTVLGGPHPTAMDVETLKENSFVDVVVRGEGEITISNLLDKKISKQFSEVKGITYRQENRIIRNDDRPFIENIDDLPMPAYHLLPMKEYTIYNRINFIGLYGKEEKIYSSISASRGCPYNCIFCECNRMLGKKLRNRNPEKIVEEIKILKEKYNVGVLGFVDDTFTINKKHFFEICNLIKKENIDILLECSTRVDTFDKETANRLKDAGFCVVFFGFESANQSSLDFLQKGFNVEDQKTAVKNARRADLFIEGNFMIGIPGENKSMINRSISFSKKLDIDQASFPILVPFPGTQLYDYAEKNNLLLTKDWSQYYWDNSVMKIKGFTQNDLKNIKTKAYINFYSNPKFIYKYFKRNVKNINNED